MQWNVLRTITLVALAGACGGTGTPARNTLVDSRDNYDPRSLDPALSTDVPTGRAVAVTLLLKGAAIAWLGGQ